MSKLQCGCCPARVTTAAGSVIVNQWQGNGMVQVTKPLCQRCKALIERTGKGEIINKEQVKQ